MMMMDPYVETQSWGREDTIFMYNAQMYMFYNHHAYVQNSWIHALSSTNHNIIYLRYEFLLNSKDPPKPAGSGSFEIPYHSKDDSRDLQSCQISCWETSTLILNRWDCHWNQWFSHLLHVFRSRSVVLRFSEDDKEIITTHHMFNRSRAGKAFLSKQKGLMSS